MSDKKSRVLVIYSDTQYSGTYIEDGIRRKRIKYKREQGEMYLAYYHTKGSGWKWGILPNGDRTPAFVSESCADNETTDDFHPPRKGWKINRDILEETVSAITKYESCSLEIIILPEGTFSGLYSQAFILTLY